PEDGPAMLDGSRHDAAVRLDQPFNPMWTMTPGRRNEVAHHHWKEEDGVNEGTEEGASHRDSHGAKHLALDALQREQWNVDEHDDRDREPNRASSEAGDF